MSSPSHQIHPTLPGGLVCIAGLGVLITGESGSGKTDALLGLIDRGHRMVADDVVELLVEQDTLYGRSPAALRGLAAVRGVGVIDLAAHYGAERIADRARIDFCVHLQPGPTTEPLAEHWDKRTIMTVVAVPRLVIAANHGRNLPLLIELAAGEHDRRQQGRHTQAAFIAAHTEALGR